MTTDGGTFQVLTRIVSGLGSLRLLGDELASLHPNSVVIVADRGVHDVGLLDEIRRQAGQPQVGHLGLVDANPDVEAVERIVVDARRAGCDVVLAVGGGSGLCAAKAVAIRLTNDGPLTAYEGSGQMPVAPAPVVAVPTTAGSGSEVSNALVLHEADRDRELVIRGPGCEPRVAVLDGSVLRGLPRTPMLFAALDALTHALEALWVTRGSPYTEVNAVAAADTILTDLPGALEDPSDLDRLQRLLDASCQANLACGNTGLGLVHALSSAPTVPLPHGYQNGALLLHVARFNESHMAPQHRGLLDRVERMFEQIEFAGVFAPGEIDATRAEAMLTASRGHTFRRNNRRSTTDDDVRALLSAAGAE